MSNKITEDISAELFRATIPVQKEVPVPKEEAPFFNKKTIQLRHSSISHSKMKEDEFDLSDEESIPMRNLDMHNILEQINAGVIQDESYLWQIIRIQAKDKEIKFENVDEDDEEMSEIH